MDNRKRIPSTVLSTVLVTVLAIYALWLICVEYRSYRQQILDSQDAQLFSVAHAVDRTLDITLDQYSRSLRFILDRPGFQAAERLYLETGDETALQSQLRDVLQQDPLSRAFFALDSSGVRMRVGGGSYRAIPATQYARSAGSVRLCRDDADGFYLSILAPGTSSLEYALILDLPALYRHVAGAQQYDSILLLDRSQQVLVRTTACGEVRTLDVRRTATHDAQDAAFLRQMGASAIQTPAAREQAVFFDAPPCNDQPGYRARMAVFAPDALDNAFFSVSVTMDYDQIAAGMRRNTLRISLYAALVAIAILHLIGKTLRMDRRSRNAEQETLQLRERNEALAEMGRRQQELVHNQRLQTIGTLTSGVAHEFNNLLTPIMAYSMLALEQLPDDQPELYDELLEIYQAARKSKKIVARISLLSSKNMEQTFKPLSLDRVTDSVASVLLPSKPANVTLETQLGCGPCRVSGSETHLTQVILNLCINALHAMEPRGGTLRLQTHIVRDETGRWAELTVYDTGHGVAPADLPHIFEPFYTTKPAGKGSGLGLPLARQILDEHKGTIRLESTPGQGAAATIRLPVPTDSPPEAAPLTDDD